MKFNEEQKFPFLTFLKREMQIDAELAVRPKLKESIAVELKRTEVQKQSVDETKKRKEKGTKTPSPEKNKSKAQKVAVVSYMKTPGETIEHPVTRFIDRKRGLPFSIADWSLEDLGGVDSPSGSLTTTDNTEAADLFDNTDVVKVAAAVV
jgi:hypothetical protein